MVTAHSDEIARIWDAKTGDCLREILAEGDGWINSAVFAGGGALVLTAVNYEVKAWAANSSEHGVRSAGEHSFSLVGHSAPVNLRCAQCVCVF